MGAQVARLSEPLEAVRKRTDVGLFSGVRAQMGSQIEVKRKAFVANVAFVGFLARVDELMPFELRVVQESLVASANLANKHPFSVRHLMFPVCSLISKNFEAIINGTCVFLVIRWQINSCF
jgi:hypothetical protein